MPKKHDGWSVLWLSLMLVSAVFVIYVATFSSWKWYWRLPALVGGVWLGGIFSWAWGMCDWRRFGCGN